MELFITFKRQNPDYDKQYADEFHFGEESDGNMKDIWETRMKAAEEIEKLEFIESGDLELQVAPPNRNEFSITIPNMSILNCYKDGRIYSQFAVSKTLLSNTHKIHKPKYNKTYFYFYFNSRKDFFKVGNNLYIVEEDLPDDTIDK